MTTEPIQLDGDLRDVLESIARHPNARLFRRDASVVRALGRGEAVVRRPTEPRLIAAERQLLQVHRVSMAELLRQVAAAALRACAEGNGALYFARPVLTKRAWLAQCRRIDALGGNLAPVRLFAPETWTPEQVRKLAFDALQFEDHPHAWSYIALSYFAEDRWSSTRSVAARVLRRPWDSSARHYLLEHLACAQSELGDYEAASRTYLSAARLAPSNVRSWARALGHAFLARDRSGVIQCDRELREIAASLEEIAPVALKFKTGYQASPRRAVEDRGSFQLLEGELSDHSRSLLHALL